MLLLSAFHMGQEKPEGSYDINSSLPEKAVGGNLGLKFWVGKRVLIYWIVFFSWTMESPLQLTGCLESLLGPHQRLNASAYVLLHGESKGRRFLGWGRSLSTQQLM